MACSFHNIKPIFLPYLLEELQRGEDALRGLHDLVALGVDLVDVAGRDVLHVLVAVPDLEGVEVAKVPRVDEGVLRDDEVAVDVVAHLDGAEEALVARLGVGGQEGEVGALDAVVLLHVLVHQLVRFA